MGEEKKKRKVAVFTEWKGNDFEKTLKDWALCKSLEKMGMEVSQNPLDAQPQKTERMDGYLISGNGIWDCGAQADGRKHFLEQAPENAVKIAYGIGMKNEKLPPEIREKMGTELDRFQGISVKSFFMAKELEKATSRPVQAAADPLFLLKKEEYEEFAARERSHFLSGLFSFGQKQEQGYLLVDLEKEEKELQESILQLAQKMQVSVVYRKDKTEKKKTASRAAGEYLRQVAGAGCVLTDRFCGTVFSLIYEKPFVALPGTEDEEEIRELLVRFGLEGHLSKEGEKTFAQEQFLVKNPKGLNRKKKYLRQHSLKILKEAFGLREEQPELVNCPTGILKQECYGCYACKEVCPEQAISMEEEKDGFYYPNVDPDKCISCGRCSQVCIRLQDRPGTEPKMPKAYAAVNRDEKTKIESSSGGVFLELARYILREKKGCVAGVRWNSQMEAVADLIEDEKELQAFSGSKYVKSRLDGILPRVRDLLQEGRTVLYSGLPCECAALRAYLGKPYENLYICEIMCHSAPSPKVLKKYLGYLEHRFRSKVVSLNFRDASKTGWRGYRSEMVARFENGKELRVNGKKNNYLRAFHNGYISRECCSFCAYIKENRRGDLTLGDFWGIQKLIPDFYDEKGNSFVLVHNAQGEKLWRAVEDHFFVRGTDLETVFAGNHDRPIGRHAAREEIFTFLDQEPTNHLLKRLNDLRES